MSHTKPLANNVEADTTVLYDVPQTSYLHRVLGFTLIEVMIAVVVVGILAAIAYPSYTRYIVKTRMKAGQHFLSELSVAQERYFTTKRDYADNITTLRLTDIDEVVQQDFEKVSIVKNSITSSISTATRTNTLTAFNLKPGFVAVLTPRSGSMLGTQYRIAINSEGQKWIETNSNCNTNWAGRCCRAGNVKSTGECPATGTNPNPTGPTTCGRPDWKTWNSFSQYDTNSLPGCPPSPSP